MLESVWQEYKLDQVEEGLRYLFPDRYFSVEDLFVLVTKGDLKGAFQYIVSNCGQAMTGQFVSVRNLLLWLLILGMMTALLSFFIEAMEAHQVANLSFYFSFLLFGTVLLKSFFELSSHAEQLMENVLLFIKLLMPTYLIAVGLSFGTAGMTASCQVLLFAIYLGEKLLIGIGIPLISCYMLLSVLNSIWREEKLQMLVDLIAKGVVLLQKVTIGIVTGISIFQSLIVPVTGTVQKNMLTKFLSAIPGIGGLAEGTINLMVGSAMIIKNSIGVVMMLLLLAMCLVPLLHIFLVAAACKIAAAFMGTVSDKRISACTNRTGEAAVMLLKTTGTCILMFLIALAIVSASVRGI